MNNATPHRAPTLILTWYATTIFLSSAILLVIEITAGRLIAPYVGVTLYSWTSIIGVILAGLSLGNWLGGRLADRGAGEVATGISLILAGLFSLASLAILVAIAPLIQHSGLDLISASFLYVCGMFFIPAVLLGIPTPVLTTRALDLDSRAGRIVGRMHALAALGSIVGTFLTGFVLIQYLGSRNIMVFSSAVLVLLGLPFFRQARKGLILGLLTLLVAVPMAVERLEGFANPCEHESHYFCLRVVDASADAPFGEARALVLDHLLHGINHKSEPDMLIAPYVHLMQELLARHTRDNPDRSPRVFFAGGGSYTQPRAVAHVMPGATVTVAELDPMVTDIVQQHLFVDTRPMNVVHGDARVILGREAANTYDAIVTDAFHDIAIPYHLVTHEYIALAKSRLRAEGLFLTNVVDAFPNPRMVKALVKTLALNFEHVDIWLDSIPPGAQRMTWVIAASDRAFETQDRLHATSGFPRSWLRVNQPLEAGGTPYSALPVFTDDYVPVERLISGLLFGRTGI